MCCQWVVHTFVHILKKTEILLAYININLINVTKKTITNNFINKSEWSSQLPLWPEIVRILATLSTYLNAFPTKMPTCINCLTFFRNDWTSQPALYDLSNIFFRTDWTSQPALYDLSNIFFRTDRTSQTALYDLSNIFFRTDWTSQTALNYLSNIFFRTDRTSQPALLLGMLHTHCKVRRV
jgi:hypothetical protein